MEKSIKKKTKKTTTKKAKNKKSDTEKPGAKITNKEKSVTAKPSETAEGLDGKTPISEKGGKSRAKDIRAVVKKQLTILMKKGASEAVRVSAAKSLMDIIYKQQEIEGYGDEQDGETERESAIAECVRLLDELAASLSARGARKITVA